jgi:hypothetical protein
VSNSTKRLRANDRRRDAGHKRSMGRVTDAGAAADSNLDQVVGDVKGSLRLRFERTRASPRCHRRVHRGVGVPRGAGEARQREELPRDHWEEEHVGGDLRGDDAHRGLCVPPGGAMPEK